MFLEKKASQNKLNKNLNNLRIALIFYFSHKLIFIILYIYIFIFNQESHFIFYYVTLIVDSFLLQTNINYL